VISQLQGLDRNWNGGTHFALPPLERLRYMAQQVDWARSFLGAAIAQAAQAESAPVPEPAPMHPYEWAGDESPISSLRSVPELAPMHPFDRRTTDGDESPISVSSAASPYF
jgi:hypothetical protein